MGSGQCYGGMADPMKCQKSLLAFVDLESSKLDFVALLRFFLKFLKTFFLSLKVLLPLQTLAKESPH